MTPIQAKETLMNWANEIIDIWFGSGSITDGLIKPSLKVIVKNNVNKVDDFLQLFTDKDGNIDIDGLLDQYMKDAIPMDGLKIDPKQFIGDNFFSRQISTKLLERSDIQKLKEMLKHGSQSNY